MQATLCVATVFLSLKFQLSFSQKNVFVANTNDINKDSTLNVTPDFAYSLCHECGHIR